MDSDRVDAVNALLMQAKEAHGTFEATELNGIYDEDWPRWYAEFIVGHGLGELVGHPIAADRLAQFLADTNDEFEATEPKPSETWSAYAAGRIAAEL